MRQINHFNSRCNSIAQFGYSHRVSSVCNANVHRVSDKETSTHIIRYKLRNSCLILIIVDIEISHIIGHRMTA